MNKEALISQLVALRATIDAALILLSQDETPQCDHKNRLSLTTMGGFESWLCKDCGFEFTGEE
ncbi:hypothetical protein [Effusibacillus pohliae]|uniref:hypothetical protein n=1 Tax=Effusibacillus pohliae TaxID=232270 RepID=UPI000363BB49|nr:hypothetical protein [Effusibacillus pohliae]